MMTKLISTSYYIYLIHKCNSKHVINSDEYAPDLYKCGKISKTKFRTKN